MVSMMVVVLLVHTLDLFSVVVSESALCVLDIFKLWQVQAPCVILTALI